MIEQYWLEFVTIAGVHLLAVASPGPDFAIVMKHSISYGRRIAIITSVGVGFGIMLHVAYSLLGLGIVIKTTPWLFNAMTYVAALYLLYLGISALRSQPHAEQLQIEQGKSQMSDKKAFFTGFLTNGLNPKATMFFLSVFAVVVSPATPLSVQLIYGLYLTAATALWFCFLSYILSSKKVQGFIGQQAHWFDRAMGLVLVLLAIQLLLPVVIGE